MSPTIEFLDGLYETLSDVRLRYNKSTGVRNVLLIFSEFKAAAITNSFNLNKSSSSQLRLTDDEGVISIEPNGVNLVFGGEEGDDLKRVECTVEIPRDDHWERFMRFMNRYASANGMMYNGQSV